MGACDCVRLGTVLLSMIRNTKLFLIMCSTYVAHRTLYDPTALHDPAALYDPATLYDPITHPHNGTIQRNGTIQYPSISATWK